LVYRIRILAHTATATDGFIETVSHISLRTIQRCLENEVLEEVQHHLFGADQEFKHHYLDCEEAITPDGGSSVRRRFIRVNAELVDG
jgi:hypothetical protein